MKRIRQAIASRFYASGNNGVDEKKLGTNSLYSTWWMLAMTLLGLCVFCGSMAAIVMVSTGTFDSEESASVVSINSSTNEAADSTSVFITMAPAPAGLPFTGDENNQVTDFDSNEYPSVIPTATPQTDLVSDPTQTEPTVEPSIPVSEPAEQPTNTNSDTEHSPHRNAPVQSQPTDSDPSNESDKVGETIFYATGDIPYDSDQARILKQQMLDLESDCEFLIHVGDIRSGDPETNPTCRREEYEEASNLLRLSHAPVFILLGDNDWTGKWYCCIVGGS